jgi:large-conductance mechanosensitive channel
MSNFSDFITQNGIIATTAGITIGFATATFVKSFVADVVMPVFFLLLVQATGKVSTSASGFFGKFLSNKEFLYANFISEFITWVVIVLSAWMILNLVYKYIVKKDGINMPQITNPFAGTKQEEKFTQEPKKEMAHQQEQPNQEHAPWAALY